ncbi:MAG: dihydrofolate reductase family protein, partial [Noviherbaspirillum sp.]
CNTTLAAVREMKQQGDRNIFAFGSANLCETLMHDDLFDEYRLAIAPILLGNGKPLFGRDPSRRKLKLLEARPLKSGCVILRYERDDTQ